MLTGLGTASRMAARSPLDIEDIVQRLLGMAMFGQMAMGPWSRMSCSWPCIPQAPHLLQTTVHMDKCVDKCTDNSGRT